MGFWDLLGKMTGADKMVDELEDGIADDPAAPADILAQLAKQRPDLRARIRQNPACTPEVREWIDTQS